MGFHDLAAADRFMCQLNSIAHDMILPRNQRKAEVTDKATGAAPNAGAARLVIGPSCAPNRITTSKCFPFRSLLRKVHGRVNPKDTVGEDAALSVYKSVS